MIGPGCKALLVAATALAAATPALAHEFTVAIAVPLSGADQSAGQAALGGFRTAARERDGHPNETSEGHLGGLDVQMEPVDSRTGAAALIGAIADLGAVIVVAPDAAMAEALRSGLPDAVVLGPDVGLTLPVDFAERYRADTGLAPTETAEFGYAAARRIDLAIRAQGGVGDPAALRAALAATNPDGLASCDHRQRCGPTSRGGRRKNRESQLSQEVDGRTLRYCAGVIGATILR